MNNAHIMGSKITYNFKNGAEGQSGRKHLASTYDQHIWRMTDAVMGSSYQGRK